ncbi:MAG: AraC family transcriptional regulator [Chthoniobacterales bacterium]
MHIVGGKADRDKNHHFKRGNDIPFWVIATVRAGTYAIEDIDGQRGVLDSTCFCLIPPHEPYVTYGMKTALPGIVFVYFTPTPAMYSLMDWPQEMKCLRVLRIPDLLLRKQIYRAIHNVIEIITSHHLEREALAMNALERVFLLARPAVKGLPPGIPQDSRILDVIDAVREKPEQAWTIKTLAKIANMSETNLRHRFARETGVSLIHYADIQRMDRAKALLLHSNDPISQIAERLGYSDIYHFSKRFREVVGRSPRAFRHDPAEEFRKYSGGGLRSQET